MRTPHRIACAIALLVAVSGCSKGCRDDHPYVPYTIEGSGVAASSSASAEPLLVDAGSAQFHAEESTIAPPGLAEWTLDGLKLVAPAGRVFLQALVRDLDGDGQKDALAIVRAADEDSAQKTSPGEIVYFHGAAGAVGGAQPVDTGVTLPDDDACRPSARLSQIGPKSAYVELAMSCPNGNASEPSRFVGVLRARETAVVRLGLAVLDPPGSAKLTIDPDGADVDGDRVDDVTFRVSLEGGSAPFEPGPKVTAVLRWLDRTSGLAREAGATEASFAQLAGASMTHAGRTKDAPSVPLAVAQIRALFRAVCPEAGGARILLNTGAASMSCGQSRALEEADIAEVRAYATMNDPLRAIAALDRAQRPPATRSSSRTSEAQAWIASLVSSPPSKLVRAIAAVPQVKRGTSPAWGPLTFEATAKLLVRTAAGVVRVDPEHGDESAAEGVNVWRSDVVSPDGALQWIEAYDPCDGVALHATFAPVAKGAVRDVALPIAPPFGPRCTSSRGEPAPAIPIAWGARGIEAVIAGETVLIAADLARASALTAPLEQPVFPGSPRSPNGKTVVVPTSQGLLVRSAGQPRALLYKAQELDGTYGQQQGCTVSDDGQRVACVRGGKAWVAIFDAAP